LINYFKDLDSKIPEENIPVHVINIDIQDNHEEATIGAFLICELASMVGLQNTSFTIKN
jgi:RNA polymerase II subunit A C-terminal domain phosphatase SSU72